jgi:hypothetical protein
LFGLSRAECRYSCGAWFDCVAEFGCTVLYFVSVQRLEHFLELFPRITLMSSLAFRSCVCVACVCVCVCVFVFRQIKCIWLLLCIVYFVINFVYVIHVILGYLTMLPVKNTSSCSLCRVDEFYAENCVLSAYAGTEFFSIHVIFHSVLN